MWKIDGLCTVHSGAAEQWRNGWMDDGENRCRASCIGMDSDILYNRYEKARKKPLRPASLSSNLSVLYGQYRMQKWHK